MTRCYRLLSLFLSYCSRKFKTVLDSGFHAMDPGFQLLDFGLFVSKTWIPDSLRCNSGFQSPGSRIPQANFSLIPDFTNKKIPCSGIRILLHKAALATDCAPRERVLNSQGWADSQSFFSQSVSDLIRNDIFLGAHDKKNDGEVYDVSKVEMHEDYSSWAGMKHDVAVVKLSRPAKLGKKISTVCLPSQGSRVKIGTQCYVTGKYWMTYGRLVSDV